MSRGNFDGYDRCSFCYQPLNGSNTIIEHDPPFQPQIVHLLSDQNATQTIDIHYDTLLGSNQDQTEDCYHLECLIYLIQTSQTNFRHPLHHELSNATVHSILNWEWPTI